MSARKDPAVFCTPRSKCSTSYPVLLLPSTHLSLSIPSAYFSFSFSCPSLRSFIRFIPCLCFLSCLLRQGCEMGGTGFESQYGQGIFLFYKNAYRFWGPPSLSPLFSGYLDSFSGMNRLGREANNSPSFSAEVKFNWSRNSTPPIRLHVFRRLLFYLLRSFIA
jgi:hypothetical protein